MLNDPSTEEWNIAMAKPGGEGGCEATVVGHLDQTTYDGKYFPFIKDTNQVDYPYQSRYFDEQEKKEGFYKARQLFDDEGLIHQVFRNFGNNRSVPKGRTEKELWHRALTIPFREVETIKYNPVTKLLCGMYAWGRMPMNMQISETFKIDKKQLEKRHESHAPHKQTLSIRKSIP